ncbi:cation:proton antiporter [Aestuariispira insulae]|uniref:Sodium/proton antiporter (CPA1 family) n=1 Tax=Aestuariispira insulae TaxID=1461337 RepID=A0A3D9HXI2_9PROT|nr:sodium:proton antiporter [Aestuariispira insulae]RED54081.1 sodium/proton antiporter (CPA1 family) [Aestuariispira insulae]
MSILDIASLLIVLAAIAGFINHRFIHLPHTIGLVIIAMVSSLGVLGLNFAAPGLGIGEAVTGLLAQIDFNEALMKGMLSFLLFAGAMHVDLDKLADKKWAVGLMATMGVITSTFLIGTAMWWILNALGQPIPYLYALLLGSLISPTDPVAVLSILKTVSIPKSLEIKIAGESLFNDGVGVVVFLVILALATGAGGHGGEMGPTEVAKLFALEAFGGAALGLIAGYIAYLALSALDEFSLEVLITLALVMGSYALAYHLHVSGPIAVVVAGLLIGNKGMKNAMSENTRDHVEKFWILLDEIFNSVLFLLIGMEVLVVGFGTDHMLAGLIAIPVVLAARMIAVSIPIRGLGLMGRQFTKGAVPVLTWGGLRGGISVALALSLPESDYKPVILTITYIVVVFSIIVQGLSIKHVIARFVKD